MQHQTGQVEGFKTAGIAAMGLVESEVAVVDPASGPAAGVERKRVEAVVETLADLCGGGESLAEVAHDARNMVTALGLYCDLLEEPGVLTRPFLHYAGELRLVATASRRLVEKLLALDLRTGSVADQFGAARVLADPIEAGRLEQARRWESMPAEPIDNLAAEVLANRNLLAALAGPAINVSVDIEGGALPVRLNGEDLTRILVNLVKNAAEAMPEGGRIQVGLHELATNATSTAEWPMRAAAKSLSLTVDDNGPGIPQKALEKIFDSGYTTRSGSSVRRGGWPASHHGLGLSITRSIVEAAGGSVHAANRAPSGARLEIALPVRLR
jgi:signal transduction histidine kinase